jgi:hypothetical protein
MVNESGDLKLIGNFRKEIDLVSANSNYNPSNTAISKTALSTQHTASLAAANDVPVKLTVNMAAIDDREAAFARLNPLMTRVHNVAKASGASAEQIKSLETFKRKLTSQKKAKPKSAAPAAGTSQPAAAKEHSTSQVSYDNRVGHTRGYLAALSTLSTYNPNEPDLKLTSLNAFADDLQAKNDAVSATFVPLSEARGLRDQLLYLADNSVVNHGLLVKAYCKGALGAKDQTYLQIKGLEFKRQKR